MINKDLYYQNQEEFAKSLDTEFIPDDFEGKLEWALLLLQQKFEPIRLTPYLPNLSQGSFNNAFLMINDSVKFLNPFVDDYGATPNIFKNINIKNIEVKKDALREAPPAKTEKTGVRANYTSPQAAIKAAQKTTYSLPLEKIPSRPGLHETFLQSAPPSKPADYAPPAQIPGSSALHENYMKYPPSKPLGKGG